MAKQKGKMAFLDTANLSEMSDTEVARHMREFNYPKYKTLVRMHLSFELDLNTDEFDLPCHEIVYEENGKTKKWNRASKKHKMGCASSIGSSPIDMLNHQIDHGFLLHRIEMINFLTHEKNIGTEGIFRKPGSASRQNDLRQHIHTRNIPIGLGDGQPYQVHDCATVFKGYLFEMPEPLLTDAHYPAHLEIAKLCQSAAASSIVSSHRPPHSERINREQRLLVCVQLLVLLLPEENRQLLHDIVIMLHAIAAHARDNKMSADNLAMVFAPSLICPRHMPPDVLNYVSRQLAYILAYMVQRGAQIFDVPAKLATDIRAYFLDRKRKKTMSPEQTLDESISDISTVNTVYTFVDREKTAAAHTANPTDTELARLYAHIHSLPESAQKRRLVKQFNKQNGQGTPLQLVVMNRLKNSEASRSAKSFGQSIKKHIFHKGIKSTPKRAATAAAVPTGVDQTPNYGPEHGKSLKFRVLFNSPAPHASNSTVVAPYIASSSSSTTTPSSSQTHTPYMHKTLETRRPSSTRLFHGPTQGKQPQLSPLSSPSVSISAPVSRQTSRDSHAEECSNSATSLCTSNSFVASASLSASSSSASSHSAAWEQTSNDQPCCAMPLKLISEAAKQLLGAGGNVGEKKTVAWLSPKRLSDDDDVEEKEPHAATLQSELKARYKSEPNLSRLLCSTTTTTTAIAEKTMANCAFATHVDTPHAKGAGCVSSSLTRKLMKGVSMSNLRFPFSTPESTKRLVRSVSSTLKRRASDDAIPHFGVVTEPLLAPLNDDAEEEDDDTDADLTFEETSDDALDAATDHRELAEEAEEESTDDTDDSDSGGSGNGTAQSLDSIEADGSSLLELRTKVPVPAYHHQLLLMHQNNRSRNMELLTSTPSQLLGRRSMSPITKSTQRMPKAMQESIMTPRSRKPVILLTTTALSASDQNQTLCLGADLSSFREQDEEIDIEGDASADDDGTPCTSNIAALRQRRHQPPTLHSDNATPYGGYKHVLRRQQLLHVRANHSLMAQSGTASAAPANGSEAEQEKSKASNDDELSNNFKEYLLTRSVLTASPVDSSFSSQPDDFGSPHEIEELDDVSQLNSSLLYCLDGNQPEESSLSSSCSTPEATIASSSSLNVDTTFKPSVGDRRYNRLATNPFVILNNARKRAASYELEKMRAQPADSNGADTQGGGSQVKGVNTALNTGVTIANKENLCEEEQSYLMTKKLLISEYPGETSF